MAPFNENLSWDPALVKTCKRLLTWNASSLSSFKSFCQLSSAVSFESFARIFLVSRPLSQQIKPLIFNEQWVYGEQCHLKMGQETVFLCIHSLLLSLLPHFSLPKKSLKKKFKSTYVHRSPSLWPGWSLWYFLQNPDIIYLFGTEINWLLVYINAILYKY